MSVSGNVQKQIVQAAASVYKESSATASGTTYVQLIASTSASILITHLYRVTPPGQNLNAATLTLATGAAASETAILTFAMAYDNTGAWFSISLPYPIRVPAGTRVAAKMSATDSFSTLGIMYVNEGTVA